MREGIDEAVAVVVRGLRQIDPETWKSAARPGVRFTPQQRGALASLADWTAGAGLELCEVIEAARARRRDA